ncbi:hypothetical protein HOK51_06355 [Candidatus Woesearchaeota archaeon]|jgi:hypothetical protein|nr:hypothetical protein [Candidatus Woesearchaeota archaeon]MBT6519445.1 hypothetical protein [Candidatus Woesearchaeota archaeon]MBT7368893.1 hypothetical protein [Candidatus Woesearchaeota archaeon]
MKEGTTSKNFFIHLAFIVFLVAGLYFILQSDHTITGKAVSNLADARVKLGGALSASPFMKNVDSMNLCVGIGGEQENWFSAVKGTTGWSVNEAPVFCSGISNEDFIIKFNNFDAFSEIISKFTPGVLLSGRAGNKYYILESRFVQSGGDITCNYDFKQKFCGAVEMMGSAAELIDADLSCCLEDLSNSEKKLLQSHLEQTGFQDETHSLSSPGVVQTLSSLAIYLFLVIFVMVGVTILVLHTQHQHKLKKQEVEITAHRQKLNQLKTFILQTKNQGYHPVQIKQHLVGLGWDEQTINHAFSELVEKENN